MKRTYYIINLIATMAFVFILTGVYRCQASFSEAAEVMFENRSGTTIEAIDINQGGKHRLLLKEDGAIFKPFRLRTNFETGYNFELMIKFSDGSQLKSVEHAAPGDQVTIVIYKHKTNRALKRANAW